MTTTLESKLKAVYEHGRIDFRVGASCKPEIPPGFCTDLSDEQKKLITESWIKGWHNESLMQALPDGFPA